MNVLVMGAGRSGRAAEKLLARTGHDSRIIDGGDAFPGGEGWAFAVASPGIPADHPWIAECGRRNIPVVSELELGAGWFRGKMLAVTGSKGKSSVVKLLADTLNAAGRAAVACGNYGKPLCEVVADGGSPEWAVVEVSSFQMEQTRRFRPAAAAMLNLQADHLDRHGDMFTYMTLKLALLRGMDSGTALLPDGFPVRDGLKPGVRLETFGAEGGDWRWRPGEVSGPGGWRVPAGGSYFDNAVLGPNAAAACALMRAAGLSPADAARGFAAFEPLPHRMQTVAEAGGVKFIDDSKATSMAALAAGVEMAGRPVRLIAGGVPKGDDPVSAIAVLQSRAKKVYLIGRCAPELSAAWGRAVPSETCGTLENAFAAALRDAEPGEAVLLSPGCSSFDQYNNYGERGDAFKALAESAAPAMRTGNKG